MLQKKPALLSFSAGAAFLVLATLPIPGAEYAFWPGEMLASLFWPQGTHSGSGGATSAVSFVVASWSVALVFWASLFFVAGGLIRRARAA
jgi:hypothetical protein